MTISRAKNRRMEKAHWFPSASVVALVALVLCSLYATISPIVMMRMFSEMNHHTLDSSIDLQQPYQRANTNNRGNATSLADAKSWKTRTGDEHIFEANNQLFSKPIVIQSIQEHISLLMFNATKTADENGEALRRERLHALKVLMDYFSETSHWMHSDIVELRHCRLDRIDYSKFSHWAAVILQDARPKFENRFTSSPAEALEIGTNNTVDAVYLEFCLGLLEVFATHSKTKESENVCDFENYPLTPENLNVLTEESALKSVPVHPQGLPRLVFVIIAFQDATHLEALIEACHMPHHRIIVHLEKRSPASFTEHVLQVANKYTNVVVVQFGSIIYTTDSVSTVNYQIMHWLTEELKLSYDYYLTLGNAAYPLYGAHELTKFFQSTKRDIWLGELRSHTNAGGMNWEYLQRKRLIFTLGDEKFTLRTKKWKQNGFDAPIPDYIKTNMTEKTNSGNQAVFSYKVVKTFVTSPQVKELFALAKFGCCCCLEERTWIAAANIIGHGNEAKEAASMFQVWGGKPKCGDGSMKNALLVPNETICYKSEDVTRGNLSERQQQSANDTSVEHSYFRGDQLLEELRLAKERGFLFARKFKSTNQDSLDLIEMIKTSIHNH